ncbi:MAG: signal peptidase II [Deltaproteobacteria bacterium]|nr:signal peptidase II [Deltaproteobacteria bacterium]
MSRRAPPKALLVLGVAVAVLLADQATKYLAVRDLTAVFERSGTEALGERVAQFYGESQLEHLARPAAIVIPGVWSHRYTENTGAAFSLFDSAPARFRKVFFVLSMILAAAFVGVFAWRLPREAPWRMVALGAILGGAVGNFIDRAAHLYVIDFIDLLYRMPWWLNIATFNIADAGISCGAAVLLVSIGREAFQT